MHYNERKALKKVKKNLLILIILIISNIYSYSQVPDNDFINQIVETLAAKSEDENSEESADYSDLFETLSYYYVHPLNINTATQEELESLKILNPLQVQAIIDYRQKYGNLASLYELYYINGIDRQTADMVMPFLTTYSDKNFSQKINWSKVLRYGRNQMFTRYQRVLETRKGYMPVPDSILAEHPNRKYLGSPYKLYYKYKFYYRNNIFAGITAEKDEGEEFFKGSQKYGFDYYSAHLFIQNWGKIKHLAIGDYNAEFGQGLVLWTGFSFGKSPFVLNTMKTPTGLKKYSSVNENNFLRGAGITYNFGNIDATVFASYKKIDANVSISDTTDNEYQIFEVSSLQNTGYHRTPGEVADKNVLPLRVMGGNLTYRDKKHLKIGMTMVNYHFGADVERQDRLYNTYEFHGQDLTNVGVDYQYSMHKLYFFGEIARSNNGAMAQIHGINFAMASNMGLSLVYRDYGTKYQSIYTSPFAEGSKPANEKGFYVGFQLFPIKYWEVSMYYDLYKFPWYRFRISEVNTTGNDFLANIIYTPSREVKMYWRYKEETKFEDLIDKSETPHIKTTVPKNIKRLRYHISYRVGNNWEFRNRIEVSRYTKDTIKENGILIYQDVVYRFNKIPLRIVGRYAIFDTDGYNARIYAYENDVLYAFSIPGYFYKGKRYYLMLKYSASHNLDFWFRISQWYYTDRHTISSNLNQINGNTKTEVKLQLRYKF